MDVLKPTIINIGGRYYRKNPIQQQQQERYEDDDMVPESHVYYDEVCDAFPENIEEMENGFRVLLDVPSAFFKYIIGKKGETRKRLENETCTQVRIPRQGEEGKIVILGRERKGVLSAKTRIDVMVQSARQREPFTHFLSIPMNAESIKDKFLEFKDDVCRFCGADQGVDETIFQNPSKLHMTLGTLVLLSETEITQARQVLDDCIQDLVRPILQGQPLSAQLRGLEYMNDDPGEVDVLYARIQLHDDSDRLQMLADRLVDKFTSAGLMQRQYDRVKLHVTAMNTLFRKDPDGAAVTYGDKGRDRGRDRESFNAHNILRLYREYDFGPYQIEKIHLSKRYSTGPDGYYSSDGQLDLR